MLRVLEPPGEGARVPQGPPLLHPWMNHPPGYTYITYIHTSHTLHAYIQQQYACMYVCKKRRSYAQPNKQYLPFVQVIEFVFPSFLRMRE